MIRTVSKMNNKNRFVFPPMLPNADVTDRKRTYGKTVTDWRLGVNCQDFKVESKEHEYIVSPQEASFQIQPLWAFDDI